jgi:hypothetical protein
MEAAANALQTESGMQMSARASRLSTDAPSTLSTQLTRQKLSVSYATRDTCLRTMDQDALGATRVPLAQHSAPSLNNASKSRTVAPPQMTVATV